MIHLLSWHLCIWSLNYQDYDDRQTINCRMCQLIRLDVKYVQCKWHTRATGATTARTNWPKRLWDNLLPVLLLPLCVCCDVMASDKMLWTHWPGYLNIHRINIGHIFISLQTHGHRVINWHELHLPSSLLDVMSYQHIKNLSIWDLQQISDQNELG